MNRIILICFALVTFSPFSGYSQNMKFKSNSTYSYFSMLDSGGSKDRAAEIHISLPDKIVIHSAGALNPAIYTILSAFKMTSPIDGHEYLDFLVLYDGEEENRLILDKDRIVIYETSEFKPNVKYDYLRYSDFEGFDMAFFLNAYKASGAALTSEAEKYLQTENFDSAVYEDKLILASHIYDDPRAYWLLSIMYDIIAKTEGLHGIDYDELKADAARYKDNAIAQGYTQEKFEQESQASNLRTNTKNHEILPQATSPYYLLLSRVNSLSCTTLRDGTKFYGITRAGVPSEGMALSPDGTITFDAIWENGKPTDPFIIKPNDNGFNNLPKTQIIRASVNGWDCYDRDGKWIYSGPLADFKPTGQYPSDPHGNLEFVIKETDEGLYIGIMQYGKRQLAAYLISPDNKLYFTNWVNDACKAKIEIEKFDFPN